MEETREPGLEELLEDEEMLHQVLLAGGFHSDSLCCLALVCRRWRSAVGKQFFRERLVGGETFYVGEARFGAIAFDELGENHPRPTRVRTLWGERVTQVALGINHTIAVLEDQRVVSFGYNKDGQLGLGHRTNQMEMSQILAFPRRIKVVKVVGRALHNLLVDDAGQVFSWGSGRYGRLGHGNTEDGLVPKKIEALAGHFAVDVSVARHSFVVTREGALFAFGFGTSGQLGLGDAYKQATCTVPVQVEMGGLRVRAAVGGFFHSVIITTEGSVYVCGKEGPRLGKGSPSNIGCLTKPMLLEGPLSGKIVVAADVALEASLFLTNKGSVYATGSNKMGQLGLGNEPEVNTPTKIPSLPSDVVSIACGDYTSWALTSDGKLFTFGLAEGSGRQQGEKDKCNLEPVLIQSFGCLPVKKVVAAGGRANIVL